MNVEVRELSPMASETQSRIAIADCDLHLGPRSFDELKPFLSSRILHHIDTYGMSHRVPWQNGNPAYPKSAPYAARRDALPPGGSPPGTDLEFTRRQHLDPFNIQLGLINPPLPSQNFMNPDLGNAICHALNEWQIESLVRPEPRLRASIVVNYEDPPAAAAEIERCAGTPGYGHILLMSRTANRSARGAMHRSSTPQRLRACRWRCMRSALPAIPPPRPAGLRSTSKTWWHTRRAFRRISPAW